MAGTPTARAAPRSGSADSARRATRHIPDRPGLEVVGAEDSTRSVGLLGTAIAAFLFATLLAMAGLHAALVQAQAGLDSLVDENAARQERVDQLLAAVAHLDSPEGVAEQAAAAGLLAAPEVVTIAPLAPGALAPPPPNPFGLGSGLVVTAGGASG
jgi:dihydrodipicolinate synthase/N-acetylneuraminate lyase